MKSGKYSMGSINRTIAIVIGLLFIVGSVFLAIKYPEDESNIFRAFKLLQALGGAAIASVLFNKIDVASDTRQLAITAGGGAAIFIIIYFLGPEGKTIAQKLAF